MSVYAAWLLLHTDPELFTTKDSRVIGVFGVAASVFGIAWLPVPAILSRFTRKAHGATITQYLILILGTTLTFIALIRDQNYHGKSDLIGAVIAGIGLAVGMLITVALSTLWAKARPLPEPGSAKDAITRTVIDREYGPSTTGFKPSDSDYSYMFATYAALRLNDAEKVALIKCAMDAFSDADLAKVETAVKAKRSPGALPFGPGPVIPSRAREPKLSTLAAVSVGSMIIGAAGGALLARSDGGGRAIEP